MPANKGKDFPQKRHGAQKARGQKDQKQGDGGVRQMEIVFMHHEILPDQDTQHQADYACQPPEDGMKL